MIVRNLGASLLVVALCSVPATDATAYFELELESGGTMVADSYAEEGDAYRLYRPGGELRIDKARVKTIRERQGRLVETTTNRPARNSDKESSQATAPAPLPDGSGLEALERELTRDVILGHRDLLFARNRGESDDELKRRKKELEQLEERRNEAQKKLGIR